MIIAVVKATFAFAKRKPEKIQACTGFEPLTSAIPVQRSTNFFFFFSGFLFAAAKVAYITAMILILHSAVHIYDFHTFIISSSFHHYWIFTIVLYK